MKVWNDRALPLWVRVFPNVARVIQLAAPQLSSSLASLIHGLFGVTGLHSCVHLETLTRS